jgi:NADPH2:quinone reductase
VKAVRFHRHGGPEALQVDEVPAPEPGPGEARIAVRAVGVNFLDVYLRTGLYDSGPLPAVAGREGAGVVEAVGPDAGGWRPGDRVAFCDARGAYAESVVHAADRLVPLPDGLDFRAGAAVLLQGMTAHYLLRAIRPLGPGDRVLIHAAAGGVGGLAVQIAKLDGAFVFATCSSEEKAAAARAAGADQVILYTRAAFADEVLRATDGRGVDLVLDGVGRSTFTDSVRAARVRGHVVLFGQSSGEPDPIRPRRLLGSRTLTSASLFDYVRGRDELRERAREVFAWLESGRLRLAIDSVLPLAEAAEAHRRLEGRASRGKILLEP